MKTIFAALLVGAIFAVVVYINHTHTEQKPPTVFVYITGNFMEDTASKNAIASILLNYRMYDTMFEALILLTAIIGMKRFLPAPHELKDES